MNTRDVEAFLAVVETGSIVAASARLNLTQPGVTRRVQSLEQTLGAELLDRQSKPLKPTPAGRQAYKQGRRLIGVIEELRSSVSPQREPAGEFRLGITPYLSEASLAAPVDTLRQTYPKLQIRITSDWSLRLIERVTGAELDAAAIGLPDGVVPPEPLIAVDIGKQPVLLVAAADLPLDEPTSLKALSRFGWVMNQDGCGFRAAIKRLFDAARLPFEVSVEAFNSDLRLSLIARGMGIGVVTSAALEASPLRDALKIVRAPDFDPQVRGWVVHRPQAGRLGPPVATFAAALEAQLRG